MPFSLRKLTNLHFIALLVLALVAIAGIAVAKRLPWDRQQSTPVPVAQQIAAAAEPLPNEFPLDSFVPVGVPVTLSNVIASILKSEDNKKEGPAQVKLQVALPTGEKVQSLNFVLLSFRSSGELELVNGWVRNADFSVAKNANVTLDLNRRITNGDKLVLTVERARSSTTTYQTDFSELSQAVIANVRKQGDSPVPVQRATTSLPDESGANLCNNALRRAVSLMQSSDKKGDKIGITSLRCNQQDRSFTITYGKTAKP